MTEPIPADTSPRAIARWLVYFRKHDIPGAASLVETLVAERDAALAERDRFEQRASAAEADLAMAKEERDDKVDGLESDLNSALDVLWRRGDEEARTWIRLNYRTFAARRQEPTTEAPGAMLPSWPIPWGTPVRKSGAGGYSGTGAMRGYAITTDGSLRLTIGHKLEGGEGELLHIYMPTQVKIDGAGAGSNQPAADHGWNEQDLATLASDLVACGESEYAAPASATQQQPAPRRFRHRKGGSTYEIVGEAELQASLYVSEGWPLTIYSCETDGKLWARPTSEFHDGRFEELPPAPGVETGKGDAANGR